MAKDVLSDEQIERVIEKHAGSYELSDDEHDSMVRFAKSILAAAEQAIRADERTRVMRAYAMRHDYLGLCPDDMQPNSYDPKCKACRAIRSLGAGSKGDAS